MDLWIRSQGKARLIKADNLFVNTTFGVMASEHLVAQYESEERALEIMNEIEATLKIFSKSREIFVYEMPEE